jgi:beta-xylosidase
MSLSINLRDGRLKTAFLLPAFLIALATASTCISKAQSVAASAQASTFQNPVLWEDLADLDIIRVGDTFYYSASNMAYSPGAPILKSYDLVHWEYVGHSLPVLDFGPAYDLLGGNAYNKGTWASFLQYRKSNKTFYWGGCIPGSKITYIYAASAAEGPWRRHASIDNCYYDAGLLIDDDDTMYVAYGNTTMHVAQLSPDGRKEVKSQVIFQTPPEVKTLEGSRFYKVNGNYYIFTTRPANGEFVLRSTTGPFGPYTLHKLLLDLGTPIPGGGVPHQGGIVQTQKGDWYYMAFVDAYPGGRIPVLAPLKWNADGWPELVLADGKWGTSYPYPLPPHPLKPNTGTDLFKGKVLGAEWEWNHNPDNARWSLDGGLNLQTATVTDDLYSARNTLTHRIPGPESTATIVMNISKMKDGDRAGLAIFKQASAWVGVKREGGEYKVVMESGLALGRGWVTASKGSEVESAPLKSKQIWLRASADIHPGPDRKANFSYSTDGRTFTAIGTPYSLNNQWMFFMGNRYAIFNYATRGLGGVVKVKFFTVTTP